MKSVRGVVTLGILTKTKSYTFNNVTAPCPELTKYTAADGEGVRLRR